MARANASPAGHTGLIDNAIGVVSALFAYVETRAALLAVESKALLLQLVSVVAFGLGAFIAVVFGYIFVMASLVVAIAHRAGFSWTWIALVTGLLHIVLGAAFVFLAKSKLRGRLYPETRSELKRDQTCSRLWERPSINKKRHCAFSAAYGDRAKRVALRARFSEKI